MDSFGRGRERESYDSVFWWLDGVWFDILSPPWSMKSPQVHREFGWHRPLCGCWKLFITRRDPSNAPTCWPQLALLCAASISGWDNKKHQKAIEKAGNPRVSQICRSIFFLLISWLVIEPFGHTQRLTTSAEVVYFLTRNVRMSLLAAGTRNDQGDEPKWKIASTCFRLETKPWSTPSQKYPKNIQKPYTKQKMQVQRAKKLTCSSLEVHLRVKNSPWTNLNVAWCDCQLSLKKVSCWVIVQYEYIRIVRYSPVARIAELANTCFQTQQTSRDISSLDRRFRSTDLPCPIKMWILNPDVIWGFLCIFDTPFAWFGAERIDLVADGWWHSTSIALDSGCMFAMIGICDATGKVR